MPTISWKDAAFAEAGGQVRYRGLIVHLRDEHIDLWKGDPDGRFKLKATAGDPATAEPDRFFPSL